MIYQLISKKQERLKLFEYGKVENINNVEYLNFGVSENKRMRRKNKSLCTVDTE